MIRNLKALGLALVAVFAFSAVAASAASAQQGKLTSDGPVTLTGEEIGGANENALTSNLGRIECPGSTYTGHKYNVTPHEFLASGATTATITPEYRNCAAHIPILGERPVTVTMNGCDYVFHLGETTGSVAGTYGVTADIAGTCEFITIHIYCAGCSHTTANERCEIRIANGQSFTGPHLTSTGEDIDLKGTFNGVEETHTGSLCGSGSGTASLDTNVTIKGHNELGEPTAVSISD